MAVENMATRVIACLGPTASPCFLEDEGMCPLVAGSAIVLVDAPFDGSFRRYWKQITAGEYAE